MAIRDSFNPELSESADPSNVDALADHFATSFPENEDMQKRISVSRKTTPETVSRIMIRKTVSGIFKTLIGNAEYDRKQREVFESN